MLMLIAAMRPFFSWQVYNAMTRSNTIKTAHPLVILNALKNTAQKPTTVLNSHNINWNSYKESKKKNKNNHTHTHCKKFIMHLYR